MQNSDEERVIFGSRAKQILDGIKARLEALETAPQPPPPPIPIEAIVTELEVRLEARFAPLAASLLDLEKRLRDTNVAVAEGIERTDRTERRIASTVARARKELRESGYDHPGVDAEAAGLREIDGGGGGGGGVQPVPEEVAADADHPSSIRGVPASYLRRARGFG